MNLKKVVACTVPTMRTTPAHFVLCKQYLSGLLVRLEQKVLKQNEMCVKWYRTEVQDTEWWIKFHSSLQPTAPSSCPRSFFFFYQSSVTSYFPAPNTSIIPSTLFLLTDPRNDVLKCSNYIPWNSYSSSSSSIGDVTQRGPLPPHSWAFYIPHNDAPQSVWLLWTSDQPIQRPLPDNTQHSQERGIHVPGGIRTRNLSRRAAADLNLRPRGHFDRPSNSTVHTK
jgi:hypothetical protein